MIRATSESRSGFSLIELITAAAVLALLAVLLVQVTHTASTSIRFSDRATDAAAQARLAFDRLAIDLSALVRGTEVDFQADNTSSTLLQFLAVVPSAGNSTDNRGASMVAYSVTPRADNSNHLCLLRADKSVSWSDRNIMGLNSSGLPIRFTDPTYPPALTVTPPDYQILAPAVFRLVIGFQLYPDNSAVKLASGETVPKAQGQIVYSPPVKTITIPNSTTTADYVDLTRVHALVIGAAAADLNTLRTLPPDQLQEIANLLTLPTADALATDAWTSVLATNTFIPPAARQGIRLFQRHYPLTRIQPKF